MKHDVSKLYFLNGTLRKNKQSEYPYISLLKNGLDNLGIYSGSNALYESVKDIQFYKGVLPGIELNTFSSTVALPSNGIRYNGIYIPQDSIVSSVHFMFSAAGGVLTSTGDNVIVLYSFDPETLQLTELTRTVNSTSVYQSRPTNVILKEDFLKPVFLKKGLYYIGIFSNFSGTAPTIVQANIGSSALILRQPTENTGFGLYIWLLSGPSVAPSTINMSTLSKASAIFWTNIS